MILHKPSKPKRRLGAAAPSIHLILIGIAEDEPLEQESLNPFSRIAIGISGQAAPGSEPRAGALSQEIQSLST